MMQLYGSLASPFVQRVLMAARAKGTDLAVAPLPGGSMQAPEFLAISPMGRIPVLALDDGRHICESGAIAGYLDETLPGPSLLPADPVDRARVREIEAVAALEFAAGMRPLMVGLVFRAPVAAGMVDAARAQVEKGASVLDRLLDGAGAYAVGDTLSLADCILTPVLQLARIVAGPAGTAGLLDANPRLADYLARMTDDPVAGRTAAEMRDGFAAVMARLAAN